MRDSIALSAGVINSKPVAQPAFAPKPYIQLESNTVADEPLIPLDPAWPHLSLEQVRAALCAPGQMFEMETVVVNGVPTRVWKNAPANLQLLIRLARGFGTQPFAVYEEERVSYEALYFAVAALAHRLQAMGVGKGDRVALAMRNLPEWPVIFFATVSIGAILVPLNAWWASGELEYGINDSGARLLFVDAERHRRLADCYDRLDGVERVVASRLSEEPGGKAVSLETLIGAAGDWHSLPDESLPEV
jgi:long-chain acyl-CoA synthetase